MIIAQGKSANKRLISSGVTIIEEAANSGQIINTFCLQYTSAIKKAKAKAFIPVFFSAKNNNKKTAK
jgi:hypothetical protein